MKKVEEIRTQILDIMKSLRIAETSVGVGGDWDLIRKAICCCYFHNVGKLKGIGEYVNLLTSVPCHLHPTSALYGLGHTPEYIVYHDVTRTTKEYMQCVTAAEPEWIADIGSKFFYLRSSHEDAARERERDKQTRALMETQSMVTERLVGQRPSMAQAVVSASTQFVARKRGLVAQSAGIVPSSPKRGSESSEDESNAAAIRRQRLREKAKKTSQ